MAAIPTFIGPCIKGHHLCSVHQKQPTPNDFKVKMMRWTTANILFADVAGYSRLTDEQMKVFATTVLAEVSAALRDIDLKDKNTWGDGIVIIAGRIADACEAALKLRNIFRDMNWGRLNLPKLDVRVSVHHGEYLEGKDTFTKRPTFCGSTVITAARIEPVTPPGRIWLTRQAADMLRAHIENDKRAGKPEFFAIDDIGSVSLAKQYGSIEIASLRLCHEKPLTEAELELIHESSRIREAGGDDKVVGDAHAMRQIKSLSVVIGVTTSGGRVLMVKRKDQSEGLTWMFPSGKKWPTADEIQTVEKEVWEETGVSARVTSKIGEIDKHPITGFRCGYFALEPISSIEVENGDPLENSEVQWVAINDAIDRMGTDLNLQVLAHLQAQLRAAE